MFTKAIEISNRASATSPVDFIHCAWFNRVLIGRLCARELSARFKGRDPGSDPTIRQPLISFASGIALWLGAEHLLLLTMVACVTITIVVLWLTAVELGIKRSLRLLMVLALLTHYSLLRFGLNYMADQVTCLIATLALREFLAMFRVNKRISPDNFYKHLICGSVLSALACVSQIYGTFPAVVAAMVLALRALLERSIRLFGAAICISLITISLEVGWRFLKFVQFGSFNATHVSHFELLKLSLANSSFYANVWPIFFAPLIVVALAFSPFISIRHRKYKLSWQILYLLAVVVMYMSFVFIYQWQESRFTIYFLGIGFLLGFALINSLLPEDPPFWATALAGVMAIYVSLAPTNDLMQPKLHNYLTTLAHPQKVFRSSLYLELMRTEPVARLSNDPCLGEPSLTGEPVKVGCDGYVYRNLQRYLYFRRRSASDA